MIFRGLINRYFHIALLAMYVIKMAVKEVESEMDWHIHLGNEALVVKMVAIVCGIMS